VIDRKGLVVFLSQSLELIVTTATLSSHLPPRWQELNCLSKEKAAAPEWLRRLGEMR